MKKSKLVQALFSCIAGASLMMLGSCENGDLSSHHKMPDKKAEKKCDKDDAYKKNSDDSKKGSEPMGKQSVKKGSSSSDSVYRQNQQTDQSSKPSRQSQSNQGY